MKTFVGGKKMHIVNSISDNNLVAFCLCGPLDTRGNTRRIVNSDLKALLYFNLLCGNCKRVLDRGIAGSVE